MPSYTPEPVLAELGEIGKYRVRILESKKGKVLDIREYVDSDTFQGFTRKGVRLSVEEWQALTEKVREGREVFPQAP